MQNKTHLLIFATDNTADVLIDLLPSNKFNIDKITLLEIEKLEINQNQILNFDILIFTSINSITCSNKYFIDLKKRNPKLTTFCMGKQSYNFLRKNFDKVFYPKNGNDSEALISEIITQINSLTNKKIAIFKGIGGRNYLQTALSEMKSEVKVFNIYRRKPIIQNAEKLNNLIKNIENKNQAINIILSSQSLEILNKAYKQHIISQNAFDQLIELPVIVNHWKIRNKAIEYGYRNVILADSMQSIPEVINTQFF